MKPPQHLTLKIKLDSSRPPNKASINFTTVWTVLLEAKGRDVCSLLPNVRAPARAQVPI